MAKIHKPDAELRCLSAGLLLPTTRAAMVYYERTKTVITESWQFRSPEAQTGSCFTQFVI